MAKLLKLRRGSTSAHASFTGAEGEVTIDTTKDTAVVHDGSQAGGRPLAREDMTNVSSASIAGQLGTDSIATTKIAGGALPTDVTVASANIVDGTIVNADVNASAAIAGTKVSPDFGSQTITTTGNIDINGQLQVGGTDTLFKQNQLRSNAPGAMFFDHGTTGQDINFRTSNSSALDVTAVTIKANGNVDFVNGVDVTGNITVTGTVDGRDVASDGSKLDGIESGATADQTKSDIDALAINADTVDSLHAASFARSDADDTLSGDITFTNAGQYPVVIGSASGMDNGRLLLRGSASPYIEFRENNTDKAFIQWHSDGFLRLNNEEDSSQLRIQDDIKFSQDGSTFHKVWHGGNHGAGSGLNADTVDGIQGSSFLRSDTADTATGDIGFSGGGGAVTINANSDIRFINGNWTGDYGAKIQHHNNLLYIQGGSTGHNFRNPSGGTVASIDTSGNLTATGNVTAYSDARLKTDIHTINDALGICGKLRGVSYKWIRDGKPSIGVIAQEIEKVIPEVVLTSHDLDPSTGESIEVKSVDYGKIVGVLINAINELKAEVDELKGGK